MHKANLINSGIIPLVFANPEDYNAIEQGDTLELHDIRACVEHGDTVTVKNITKNTEIVLNAEFSDRARNILLAGGLLNYTAERK